MARSHSSVASTPWLDRVREWLALARLSIADAGHRDFSELDASLQQHDGYARRYLGRPLTDCKAIEIGYGARPNRLIWFCGNGVDIVGIDLDRPILRGSPREFLEVYRNNGWERALKTVARWYLNERSLRRSMLAELSRRRRGEVQLTPDLLAVGDAARADFWRAHPGADYVFSEDVVEHIPADALDAMMAMMAAMMDPNGVACIKPMVFTGICGGHHVEWYPHTFSQPINRLAEPWEHLRQDRHRANTYLNRLALADYRTVFSRHFEILEETVVAPDLGKQFMTAAIRDELSAYPDDELYSNGVFFVLRPLPRS